MKEAQQEMMDILDQVAECCENMICVGCGGELDAPTDCDCPCHMREYEETQA